MTLIKTRQQEQQLTLTVRPLPPRTEKLSSKQALVSY